MVDGEQEQQRATEDVMSGVTEVVNVALGLAGDLARRTAEATVPPERTVAAAQPGAAPVNVVVHYGVATVTNIVQMVGNAVRDANAADRGAPTTPGPASTSAAARPAGPTITAGETLRIPLSIENPDSQPMQQLTFAALAVDHDDATAGVELGTSALRFEPETLTIAAHDFEKLTVFVDTRPDTAPGRYHAVIGLGATKHEVDVRFVVAAAEP